MLAEISEDEFKLFRDLIHGECGLYFADNKRGFLSTRIAKRLQAKNIKSVYRYYRYLKEQGAEQQDELLRLLDSLTINETSFFRNRPQFELLEQIIIPELVGRNARGDVIQLRIWSAGCSTGEEPYSIAMSVLRSLPRTVRCEVTIFASDLSLSALEAATEGVYAENKLADIEPGRHRQFFERCPGGFRVRDELKQVVVYDFHNLKHDNGLRDLDIVFCRNVLIYFDPEEQKKVVARFVRALKPGGYLFLGHSESVQGTTDELKFVHHGHGNAYRKVSQE